MYAAVWKGKKEKLIKRIYSTMCAYGFQRIFSYRLNFVMQMCCHGARPHLCQSGSGESSLVLQSYSVPPRPQALCSVHIYSTLFNTGVITGMHAIMFNTLLRTSGTRRSVTVLQAPVRSVKRIPGRRTVIRQYSTPSEQRGTPKSQYRSAAGGSIIFV